MLLITLLPITAYANINSIELVDQHAQLLLHMQIDENYEMQTSSNLIDWLPVEPHSTETSSDT